MNGKTYSNKFGYYEPVEHCFSSFFILIDSRMNHFESF